MSTSVVVSGNEDEIKEIVGIPKEPCTKLLDTVEGLDS